MQLVLLLSLIVTVAFAQDPKPCAGPKVYEGRFKRFNRERGLVEGIVAYDGVNKRFREIETTQGDQDAYDTLWLQENNMEFRVNRKTKECSITHPKLSFRPVEVPSDATYTRAGVIKVSGTPNPPSVASFHGSLDGDMIYFSTVTYPECIPVETGFASPGKGLEMTMYFDVQEGISDPEFFSPPEEC